MARTKLGLGLALTALMLASAPAPAQADPAKCLKTVLGSLRKFKKVHLKAHEKCLDADNAGKIPGPCPDTTAQDRIDGTKLKIIAKNNAACTGADLTALGFSGSCNFKPGAQGAEGQCALLPASTPQELTECFTCWKTAELNAYVAILYASHADEICGNDLGATSPECSPLDCSTPKPLQRDLPDNERDCQRAIAKAGIKYFLSREKVLEKCGLDGATRTTCLADTEVTERLTLAEAKKQTVINNKCGNRVPVADPPFCCRTGTGNQCVAAATRDDCTNGGDTVQENKVCGVSNTCDPTPGMQGMTWWENCPTSTCGGQPVTDLDGLIGCVDSAADEIVDDLLCMQFPSGWCASPSGAFLD